MSLKILINNEEVVCDKNITIKEEMLSTSSTILKNCYPKSWEITKDYVSNYYFPKDYSKCKIIDKEEINFTIWGATGQSAGASPDNPQDIVIKTGNTEEIIDGKRYTINLGNLEIGRVAQDWDLLYKENNIWYVRRVMKKLFFNGTENWTKIEQGDNTTMFGLDEDIGYKATGSVSTEGFCNYFSRLINGSVYDGEGFWFTSEGYIRFRIDKTIASTIEEFKEWLSTHEVELYFLKQDTTIETLTDTNLINQLNSIGENLIFCGCVKNTGNISLNPRQPHYADLQLLDFKCLLSEGKIFDYVIVNKKVSEAINQVVDSIRDYGFVVGNININNDDLIGAYSTKDKSAYDIFQYFADITQSRWYTRLINENQVAIDFYDPFLLPEGTSLNYNNLDCSIKDISFNYSTNDYRNKQIMTSNEVFSNVETSETIVANGYQTQYNTTDKIGSISKIKVNGVDAVVLTKDEYESGASCDFYYTPGNNYFESVNNINAGSLILVQYYAIIEGRQIIINQNEINRINSQTNRNGTITRYENRSDATTTNELNQIGLSYLEFKGSPEVILKVSTINNNLWNIGQLITTTNMPINDLNDTYMVKNKETQMIKTTNDIFYTFELTSNFNSEDKINYFDNQRAKTNGNIAQGEYISRNIDIQNTANIIFYNLQVEEVAVVGDNILSSVLNSPLNN